MIKTIKLKKLMKTKEVLKKYPNMATFEEFWQWASPKNPITQGFYFTIKRVNRKLMFIHMECRDGGRGISNFPVRPDDEWLEFYQVVVNV